MELSQAEKYVVRTQRAMPAVPKPSTRFDYGVPFGIAPTIAVATVPALTTENMPIGGPNLQVETSATAVPLPVSFRPLPASITVEDAIHLQNRGALAVPSIELQNALFLAFVNYVYPYMPVLDLQQFVDALNCRDGRKGRVSLLLFHAVMFAGTAFVDIKWLRDAGCVTRIKARRAFFLKTKLLYDFDYEPDRLVVVQALLLMSYWYEASDVQKDASHWIGVAAALARTIGLDQNISRVARTPEQKMWKRIWWSCFMRDCLIAIGTRRPRQVLNALDVPMLTESDFEPHVILQDSPGMLPACSLLGDIGLARKLAALCVSKARLCLSISHVLDAQYSIQHRCAMSTEDTVQSLMMLSPNQIPDINRVELIDKDLDHWAETLPTCCQYRTVARSGLREREAVVTVHRTLLHMIYNNAISALHRPLLLSRVLHTQRWIYQWSQLRVSNAAAQVAHMAADLHRLGLVGFLPAPAITTIMPAMLVQLSEMKGPLSQARKHAAERLRQCTIVLERLRDIHTAADVAFDVVNAAAKRAVVGINSDLQPVLVVGQGPHISLEMRLQLPSSETGDIRGRDDGTGERTPTLDAEEDKLHALGLGLNSPFNIGFDSPSQSSPVPGFAVSDDTYMDIVGDSPQQEAVLLAMDSIRPAVEMAAITNTDGTQMYGLETGDSYQWSRRFPGSEFGTINKSRWTGMIEEGWGYPSNEIQEQYESLAETFGLTLKT